MNLTVLKQLIKKFWLPSSVVAILFLVTLKIYIGYTNPPVSTQPIPPPIIEQDPQQKQPEVVDTSKLGRINVPKSLPVYTAEKLNLTQEAAQETAAKFSINSQPLLVDENTRDGTQYTWQENTKTLAISQTAVRYKNLPGDIPARELPEPDLVAMAASFLSGLQFLGGDLNIDPQKTTYLTVSGDRYISTGSYQAAQFVQFSFDKNISGHPIYTNSTSPSFVTITLRKDGAVTSLSARFFQTLKQGSNYKLKSAEEAVGEIVSGRGAIISTFLLDQNNQAVELYSVTPTDVQNTNITSAKMAYFLPKNPAEPIQPIFVFTGLFKKDNINGEILIYLPALTNTNP